MLIGRMIDVVLAIAAAGWIAFAGMSGEVQAAAYDTSRLDRMPDFSQTDRRLGLAKGGGSHYCACRLPPRMCWCGWQSSAATRT